MKLQTLLELYQYMNGYLTRSDLSLQGLHYRDRDNVGDRFAAIASSSAGHFYGVISLPKFARVLSSLPLIPISPNPSSNLLHSPDLLSFPPLHSPLLTKSCYSAQIGLQLSTPCLSFPRVGKYSFCMLTQDLRT